VDIMIGVILILLTGVFFYKYKIEGLKIIATKFIIYAEEIYISKEGQEKLRWVIKKIREITPFYLRWIVSEKILIDIIEEVLSSLQFQFGATLEKQLAIINTTLNLSENNNLTMNLKQMEKEIKENGYIEGFVNTDFKENLSAGIKAGMKF
jgi:hypothetical protein